MDTGALPAASCTVLALRRQTGRGNCDEHIGLDSLPLSCTGKGRALVRVAMQARCKRRESVTGAEGYRMTCEDTDRDEESGCVRACIRCV